MTVQEVVTRNMQRHITDLQRDRNRLRDTLEQIAAVPLADPDLYAATVSRLAREALEGRDAT